MENEELKSDDVDKLKKTPKRKPELQECTSKVKQMKAKIKKPSLGDKNGNEVKVIKKLKMDQESESSSLNCIYIYKHSLKKSGLAFRLTVI